MEDFTKLVYLLIGSSKFDNVQNNFEKLKTDQERVTYTLNIMCQNYDIIPDAANRLKNAEESEKLRKEGNNIFVGLCHKFDSAMCHKALGLYTKSVALAPETSKQLPLAYANRSAMLLELGLYSECIQDIDRALHLNYPNDLKGKLYVRKTVCLIMLVDHTAKSVIKEARYWVNNMTLDSNKLRLQAKLDALCQKIEQLNIQEDSVKLEEPKSDLARPVIRSCNTEAPCASDAVAIKYDAHNGRHVVATRDIDVGEVLVVEKPYSLLLVQENVLEHCSNCLSVCWATIPCRYCTYAMYCSERCRDIEWSKCHYVECAVFPIMVDRDFCDTDLFSLRLAVLAVKEAGDIQGLRTVLAEADKSDDPRTVGFSSDGKLHSSKYISLYNLERNTDKRSFPNLFCSTVRTCFILYALAKHTMFFGAKLSGNLRALSTNENVTFIGGLILSHQQMISINVHKFSEVRDLNIAVRGIAITTFCSLFNHSCHPNVHITSRPKHVVSYAVFPIKKGEQLLWAYGAVNYTGTQKVLRRQQLLEQYHFFCRCVACEENWPVGNNCESLLNLSMIKKPGNEGIMMGAFETFANYIPLVEAGDIVDKPYIVEDFLTIIRVLYDRVPISCPLLNVVVQSLKLIYEYHGNKFALPTVQTRDI